MLWFLKPRNSYFAIFLLSFLAFLISVFSEIFLEKKPCLLCLITRFMFLLTAISSVAGLLLKKSTFAKKLVMIITALSVLFCLYHLGVENHWWAAPKSCATKLPSPEELRNSAKYIEEEKYSNCDQVNLEIFGFSMTLLAFLLSAG
ncbi:MAG: disulfide bond formation protein B, partial [Holosporales bacterium]|nr:disulfide bond formation protein B [Holosporales bacterium]